MSSAAVVRAAGPGDPADAVAALVNGVYAVAEQGLWRPGFRRTSAADLRRLTAAGELLVAERDGRLVGAVRVFDSPYDGAAGMFGMLAVAEDERGAGVGRALVVAAEQRAVGRGQRAMELEILVPADGAHASKEFLRRWYADRGYVLVRVDPVATHYQWLVPLLAVDCRIEGYAKALAG